MIHRISIIAAIDSKRGLGKNNKLLFKIPEDFARMKRLTMGHPIIMGRKTFESIGRALPGRTNIIITRDTGYEREGVVIGNSLENAIKKAEECPGADEIFIFGGGQIFKEAMEKDLVDRLYVTIVKGDYGADIFFPDFSQFTRVLKEEKRSSSDYIYTFLDLEK